MRRKLLIALLVLFLLVVLREGAGFLLDRAGSLGPLAMSASGEPSLEPELYGLRAELWAIDAPMYRLSATERWTAGSAPTNRFVIPAERVKGHEPFRVQVHYRNILREERTPWLILNPKEALVNARMFHLYDGHPWVDFKEVSPGTCVMEVREKTDKLVTLVYTVWGPYIDGDAGPRDILSGVGVPEGVAEVPLGWCPVKALLHVRAVTGRHEFQNMMLVNGAWRSEVQGSGP